MLIKGDKRVTLEESKFYVDCEFNVAKATKILGVVANPRVVEQETAKGEAKVKVGVAFNLLYQSDLGIESISESREQVVTIRNASIDAGVELLVNTVAIDTENVGNPNVRVRGEFALGGFVFRPTAYEQWNDSGEVLTRDEVVKIQRTVPISPAEIVASGSQDAPERVERILATSTSIIINKVTVATETCEIMGECHTSVAYIAGGNLQSRALCTPFQTEILAAGVGGSDSVYCKGYPESTSVTYDEKNGSFRAEVIIKIRGFACINEDYTLITDAYSKSKEIQTDFQNLEYQECTCVSGFKEKLGGTFRLAESSKKIRSVLGVVSPAAGQVKIDGGESPMATGTLTAWVIYLDEDEGVCTVKVKVPYSFALGADFDCGTALEGYGEVLGCSAGAKHNDELAISAELGFDVFGNIQKSARYLKSLNVLGDKEKSDVAISLYFVGENEGLWDVAKALSSDEETLMNLNPDLTLPLKSGDRVLLYQE